MSSNNNMTDRDDILYDVWDWVKTIAVALVITIFIKMFIVDAT